MSREEIKKRFRETKLGKKIFKKYKINLIIFVITHFLMLLSFILFIPQLKSIISGRLGVFSIILGILLIIFACLTFVFGILLLYVDGKIVGCVELFDLMLKAQSKKNS